jgi:multidrug efflux pump subunit AcrB
VAFGAAIRAASRGLHAMWIVRIALDRPYTFIVLALLILFLSPTIISRTPADLFPSVNIPVIAIDFTYTGLSPQQFEGRLTSVYERTLTSLVDNIQHIESTTYNGSAVIKVFLQPHASLDTANAQVTAVSQFILRQMPPGTLPPQIINYSASDLPVLQLGLSGMSEAQLNDVGLNFLRTQLVTVPGAVVPYPYGGKQRQVSVNLNPRLLQAKNLSPQDVLTALGRQNLVQPSGTAKIGEFEYAVEVNAAPKTVEALNDLPIKQSGTSTIYLRDVATVSDGFAPQTNIERQDGRRGVLMTIIKAGSASTLDVVAGIRAMVQRTIPTLPPQFKIKPLADQSVFVSAAVAGVIREAIIAAGLTALMILIFLGSWRSTLIIAVSIPLSILSSTIVLSMLGQTFNIMTLGGLALAVGILVDDATVTIENMERYVEEGHELYDAILEGAAQIATPALVSTLCICIVFVPMFFLGGVARYLFVPLAEAVVFAMLASYVLSRTLVPTMALYLLRAKHRHSGTARNPFVRFQLGFERNFERLRQGYRGLLSVLVERRAVFIPAFLGVCVLICLLVPWLGEDFFPSTDGGQFILHMRAKTGTRIEETARQTDLVEKFIRTRLPAAEIDNIVDTIGLPYSGLNLMHSSSGLIGASDADIMVTLTRSHHPTAGYVRALRKSLPGRFPGQMFYFLPADMITQILNFGVPAAIDVQVEGSDIESNRRIADRMLADLRHVAGVVDAHIQEPFDYPSLDVDVDRTKANQGGFTEQDVSTSLLNILSGSSQVTPTYFLYWNNGVNYSLVTQAPQYDIQSLQDLQNIPITASTATRPEILADVASITRNDEMGVVNHYNIHRVIDLYASVQDRALGSAARDINRVIEAYRPQLPRGSFITLRGQVDTMNRSYADLVSGLGFSVMLVYLLIVVNFQSWKDPFIIITALPAALAGIVLLLFFTHTSLSVPALMGAIMCVGVATANSILVVSFARDELAKHGDAVRAAVQAGFIRFRPVLMTAIAMIVGMIPMSLGLGDGGEQNAPLGRAVIGGLLLATMATLIFVPAVFALLHGRDKTAKAGPLVGRGTIHLREDDGTQR